jgi:PrtD family type I secretion system ABC transporter
MDLLRNNLLRHSLSTGRGALLPIGLFSMVLNLLALTVPLYMMQIYDRVLTSSSLETLLYLTIMVGGVILVIALLDATRSLIAVRVSRWLEEHLAPEAFARAVEAALYHRDYSTQALRDLSTMRSFISGVIVFTLFDALWVPVYMTFLFLLHPWLGIAALLGSLVLMALALLNEGVTRTLLQTANELCIKGMQSAEMTMRNAEAIIGMGMTARVTAKWMAENNRVLDLQLAVSRRSTAIVSATKALRLMLQITILASGAILVLDQRISSGTMIAASILMSRALAPVEQAIGTWKQVVGYRAARNRLMRFFNMPVLPQRGMELPVPRGRLSVEDITFAMPGAQEAVLKRVSFVAEPGEVIAIVGPSAAGKSSLVRLIVATWRPNVGAVRLDGANVYDWPREDFGRHIGYLPQDVELFAGTVRDNIARMGEATDEDVVTAAQIAGVHEMILQLPKGYQTEIGEGGAKLSAGQRQRVALARAVFGRPRLVVLDEPNANLDADGDLALAQAVIALKGTGATMIVVSHRQSILMQADKILVMCNGMVEQFGPRNDVLRQLRLQHRREAGAPQPSPITAADHAEQRTAS